MVFGKNSGGDGGGGGGDGGDGGDGSGGGGGNTGRITRIIYTYILLTYKSHGQAYTNIGYFKRRETADYFFFYLTI